MDTAPDVRSQLQALKIPRGQRPAAGVAAARGRGAVKFLTVCALLAALGVGLYFGRERISLVLAGSTQAAEVRLVNVTRQREPEAAALLTATGKIVSDHKVQVTTKVSGQIVALSFEQGDRVKNGQVLARIEDVIYRARRDEAAARLEKSRAQLAFQKINFARTERLFRDASAPEIEYADSKRAFEEAQAEVVAAQAALDYS